MAITFSDRHRALSFARACGAKNWHEHVLSDCIPAEFLAEAHDAYESGRAWRDRRYGASFLSEVVRHVSGWRTPK